MYNQFCVTGIKSSLSKKQIKVDFNFKVNPDSANKSTIKLVNSSTGVADNYTIEVNDKIILITFVDYPVVNTMYYLTIIDIHDMLDRQLSLPFEKTITFKSQLKLKLHIAEPSLGESILTDHISVKVKTEPDNTNPIGIRYEISTDIEFCDVVSSVVIPDLNYTFTNIKDGQYYIRVREENLTNPSRYGNWSNTTDIILVHSLHECDTESDNENSYQEEINKLNEDNPFIEAILNEDKVLIERQPIKLLSNLTNGKTQTPITLVFNEEIDIDSLPEYIIALRRDL